MTKFHINKHGLPAVCKAQPGGCPLGDNSVHFKTEQAAQLHINSVNEKEFGILPPTNNNKANLNEKLAQVFDEKHLSILKRLNEANFEAYFVGGSLRDAVLGLPINDVDITTSAIPEKTMEVFSDYKVIPVGLEHGTVAMIVDGEQIEVTTFRNDGEYSDGRHPDEVTFTNSLEEDLQRRDFTINALAYNQEGLVDLVNGLDDIDERLIRAVGDPAKRFQEDPLRIMRGLRFASKLSFDIEENTGKAILENKGLLKNISAERIQQELNGLLLGKNANSVLTKYSSVISEVIPEIKNMIGFDQQNPHHHLDVWEHSSSVVDNAKDDIAHKLAAVFHDSGKPSTYVFNEEKQIANFLGHAEESVKIAEKALTRLKYDNKTKTRVLNIITDHDFNLSTKPYKIKKAIYELGSDRFQDMVDFKKADDKSKNLEFKNDLHKYDEVERITKEYLAGNPILSHKDLDIKPKDLMDLGIKGKAIGDTLNELALLTLGGHANNREKQIEYVRNNKL